MGAAPAQISVLHVDDDPELAEMAMTFLEQADDRLEVVTATSAAEGEELLAAEEFDCIVSDYDMPGRTGIDFLRSVRADAPDLPFILYTGKGSEEIASDAISAGATDYLQKGTGSEQYELLANRITNSVSRAESQRARRYLRELAENTDRVLYIFTHDWEELLFINSAYETLWGRSTQTLHEDPTDFLTGIHPADRSAAMAAMDRISDGETVDVELRVNERENFDIWAHVRGEPIRNEAGDVVRVAGFGTDITERKELEEELQKRTKRLQEAQRVAGVGSWEWDAKSDTVVWSDETYRIFGWDPATRTDPTFEDWLSAVHPADQAKAQEAVEEAMATGTFPVFEHRLQRPDGEIKWVRCRGEVVQEDGETTQITGTVLDITDRRREDGQPQ